MAISNEDADPMMVLFVDEDAKPAAKMFARSNESARVSLPAGAYDVLFEGGKDWDGERFGACSVKGKVKGIVVIEPDTSSHVFLMGTSSFVLANRLEESVATRLLQDDQARRVAKSAAVNSRGLHPTREERPNYSEKTASTARGPVASGVVIPLKN